MSGPDFYTFFYTAGRYRLVRSGTDRCVECAKPQPRGTKRDTTGPRDTLSFMLITRRSQVQILPPPPSRMQCSQGLRGFWGSCVVLARYRVSTDRYRLCGEVLLVVFA